MSKLLFIGSVTADVILRVPALPGPGDDLHVLSQQISLGGCAYNAFHTASLHPQARCTLFAPVGGGVWGDWVRDALRRRGVATPIAPVEDPNGCCYCLVTPDGERSFLSCHGAEYRFSPEWFRRLDDDYDGVYVCGLELEEATGENILDYLEAHPPRRLYFAPGPRICRIEPRRMARMMALKPVFHLNEAEAQMFTRSEDNAQAAALIRSLTCQDVIVTLGAQGAYLLTAQGGRTLPGFPVQPVDTIGAGDAHLGAVMAAEAAGLAADQAVLQANRISAAVAAQSGAELSASAYRQAMEEFL